MRYSSLLLSALSLSSTTLATYVEDVESDVCIIGGGSSGTYAAVRLQQMGKSVTVVEKQSQLGGKHFVITIVRGN